MIDESLFPAEGIDGPGSPAGGDSASEAPVGAASFNWNSVGVAVGGGPRLGESAQATLDPPNDHVRLVNLALTTADRTPAVEVTRNAAGDTVTVTGHVPPNLPEFEAYRPIGEPALWTGANVREFLRQRGVQVQGTITRGKVPASARVLADSPSQSIQQIVQAMMKYSNNFMAEMLVRDLSAARGSRPASLASGLGVLKATLDDMGVQGARFELYDASGLSHRNKFRARDLGALLGAISRDFTIYPEYLAALPVAGADGTLHARMRGSPAERWVRAKTGSLDGVVSMAGYAGRRDGAPIVFAFLYNGPVPPDRIHDLFDRLAAEIAR